MRTKYRRIFKGKDTEVIKGYAQALAMLDQAGFKGIWGHLIMVNGEVTRRDSRMNDLVEYQKKGE